MTDLQFPIGKFQAKPELTSAERQTLIGQLADAPQLFIAATQGLTDAHLDTPYRPEGWTVRQVVHHIADSHMNMVIRIRLALTEDHPTIKPYKQQLWSELEDSKSAPVDLSLTIIEAVHKRLVFLLRSLPESSFQRTVYHPENGDMTIDRLIQLYAWHGRHHAAHIAALRDRMGWK
ncbi:MAG: putative metal-dependent hydrolase [bacterium]